MTPDSIKPRSPVLDIIARATTALSAIGLLGLLIGRIVGAKGFSSSDKDTSTLSYLCFAAFVLALLIAVITGAIAWYTGRRSNQPNGVTTGKIVAGYLLIAVVTFSILGATS